MSSSSQENQGIVEKVQQLYAQGELEEALALADAELQQNPDSHAALFARSLALTFLQRYTAALITLQTLQQTAPGYPQSAWMRAGLVRLLEGELHPSLPENYREALQQEPDNPWIRLEYADILKAAGSSEQALQEYQKAALLLPPPDPLGLEALFKAGCTAFALGNTEAAIEALRQLLAHSPDYPDAQEMYAMLTTC